MKYFSNEYDEFVLRSLYDVVHLWLCTALKTALKCWKWCKAGACVPFLKLASLPKKVNNDSDKDHILNSEFFKINDINDKTATLKKIK